MAVHILEVTFQFRTYQPGQSYETGDDHTGFVMGQACGDMVYLSAGTTNGRAGKISTADMVDIALKLQAKGYRRIQMHRLKGHTMPFGRIILEGEIDNLWELNFHDLPTHRTSRLVQRVFVANALT